MSSTEWSLAVRNLLRNRRRSLSTLLALAIGLASIMLFSGFKAHLGYTMLTAYARAGGYEALIEKIRNDEQLKPMLAVVTPMLRFGGLAGNFDAGVSRTIIGTGFVAEDVSRMREWNEFQVPITRPSFPLQGTAPDAA